VKLINQQNVSPVEHFPHALVWCADIIGPTVL